MCAWQAQFETHVSAMCTKTFVLALWWGMALLRSWLAAVLAAVETRHWLCATWGPAFALIDVALGAPQATLLWLQMAQGSAYRNAILHMCCKGVRWQSAARAAV